MMSIGVIHIRSSVRNDVLVWEMDRNNLNWRGKKKEEGEQVQNQRSTQPNLGLENKKETAYT